MAGFIVFFYALLASFVVQSMQRNRRLARPDNHMVVAVGWGLFSLSSTLAVLMGAVALAMALGFHIRLPEGFDAPLF
jgi:hypothetical protein